MHARAHYENVILPTLPDYLPLEKLREIEVKTLRNKSTTAAVALVLMLTIAVTVITGLPIAFAQVERETTAYLSCRPNPIGINQELLVNIWVVPFDTAGFDNFVTTITDPDGITVTKTQDSFGDGSQWFTYVPDKTGTWKLKFSWAGQTIGSWIYQPCESPELTLTVQQEQIPYWPPAKLPTDYWEHPIHPDNREWYTIAGNWLSTWYNASGQAYNPYTWAPNSAHVVWKYQAALGGIVGGEYGPTAYGYPPTAAIAIGGLTFLPRADGTHAINVHTGETLWVKEGVPTTTAMFEIGAGIIMDATPYLVDIGRDYLRKYDPFTGELVVDVPGMSGTFDGTYVYSTSGGYLIKWNAWGSSSNFASRVVWNVTDPGIRISYILGDVGVSITSPGGMSGAVDLTDGSVLWNWTLAESDRPYTTACCVYDGKIAVPMLYTEAGEGGVYKCWDIKTGDLEWTSDPAYAYPWGSFHDYHTEAAYGMFYTHTYAGVYALNASTGKVVWHYDHPPEYPFENVYGNSYPFFNSRKGARVADGKIYIVNCEHTPNNPLARGWKLHCIDCYTGKGIWNITFTSAGWGTDYWFIAYGLLVAANRHDGYLYAFGKGQTATTVSVSSAVISKGSGVLIEGTVLDQSPAQPGTPCVSEESMSAWMEHLHMQKPAPGIGATTGVPVDLRACGSDGSVIDIGQVTSDSKGCFMCEWTPTDEDLYTVTATFNGDESYYSSWAETGLSVGAAPPEPTEPAVQEDIDEAVDNLNDSFMPLFYGLIVAVAIAIIIGIVNLWALRKR
jgi:hypothetical protein